VLNVLICGEFSGAFRDAFRALGHNAWSCDFMGRATHWDAPDLEFRSFWRNTWNRQRWPDYHLVGDWSYFIVGHDGRPWDLIIGHPTCTYLTNAGARWLYVGGRGDVIDAERWRLMHAGVRAFNALKAANCAHIALENPVPHPHAGHLMGPYSQTIQPWELGVPAFKRTCWWLKGLPNIERRNVIEPQPKNGTAEHKAWSYVHRARKTPWRWILRSVTEPVVAREIAQQWSDYLLERPCV